MEDTLNAAATFSGVDGGDDHENEKDSDCCVQ